MQEWMKDKVGEDGRDGWRSEEAQFDFLGAMIPNLDCTAGSLSSLQYSPALSLNPIPLDSGLIGLSCRQDNAIFADSPGNSVVHPG